MSVEFATAPELPPHVAQLRNAANTLYDYASVFAEDPNLPEHVTYSQGENNEAMFTYHLDGSEFTTNTISIWRDIDGEPTVVLANQYPSSQGFGRTMREVTTYPLGPDSVGPYKVVHEGRLSLYGDFTREVESKVEMVPDDEGKLAASLSASIKALSGYGRQEKEPAKVSRLSRILSVLHVKAT